MTNFLCLIQIWSIFFTLTISCRTNPETSYSAGKSRGLGSSSSPAAEPSPETSIEPWVEELKNEPQPGVLPAIKKTPSPGKAMRCQLRSQNERNQDLVRLCASLSSEAECRKGAQGQCIWSQAPL